MRLYIIRHGHVTYRRGIPLNSVPPEERSYLPDPALTEVGRKQAVLLGEHLSRRHCLVRTAAASAHGSIGLRDYAPLL